MLDRKTALVTGAGRGIGRAVALALAENGYDLGVNYCNSREGAREVCALIEARGAKALPLHGDIARMPEIDSVFERFLAEFGRIDLLVNNAGVTRFSRFLETTEELWDEVTSIDWKGTFFCTQRAARSMVETAVRGTIVNITSNHQDGCWPRAAVYASTKAAVAKFTCNAALELAKHGIRVNAIAPGYTVSAERSRAPGPVSARIPLGRLASYEEIADAVVLLASDRMAYMTGACLTIDGGALLPVVVENEYM